MCFILYKVAELDSVSAVAPNWLHEIEKDDKKMLTGTWT